MSSATNPFGRTKDSSTLEANVGERLLGRDQSKRFALVIGVNGVKPECQGDANLRPLEWAENDAEAIYKWMVAPGGPFLDDRTHVTFLPGEKATRYAIIDKMKQLANALPDDAVVWVYVSCHASSVADETFLILWDTDRRSMEQFRNTALGRDELDLYLRKLVGNETSSRAVVAFLDCCFAAGAAPQTNLSGVEFTEARLREVLAHNRLIALTAARQTQRAVELDHVQHGVFTHCALEGLKGKADVDLDSRVTVQDLMAYLQREVPNMAWLKFAHRQFPTMVGKEDLAASLVLAWPDAEAEKERLLELVKNLTLPNGGLTPEEGDYIRNLFEREKSQADLDLMRNLAQWGQTEEPSAQQIKWLLRGVIGGAASRVERRAGWGTLLEIVPPPSKQGPVSESLLSLTDAVEAAARATELEVRKWNDATEHALGPIRSADVVVVVADEPPSADLSAALEGAIRPPLLVRSANRGARPARFEVVRLPDGAHEPGEPLGAMKDRLIDAIRSTQQEPRRRESSRVTGTAFGTLESPLMPPDVTFLTRRFRGREALVEEAKRILSQDEAHVIALWGPLGSGRTSLVQKVLCELDAEGRPGGPRFDGVAYVSAIDEAGRPCDCEKVVRDVFEACGMAMGDAARAMSLWKRIAESSPPFGPLFELLGRGRFALVIDDIDGALDGAGAFRKEHGLLGELVDAFRAGKCDARLFVTAQRPLAGAAGTRSLEVGPLEPPAATALLRDLDHSGAAGLQSAPDERLVGIARSLRGNPRALRALFRALTGPATRGASPEGVVSTPEFQAMDFDALAKTQLARLEPDARRIVDILAVFGRAGAPFEGVLSVAADTLDLEQKKAKELSRQLLDELAGRALVEWNPTRVHVALGKAVRRHAYAELPAARKSQLHSSIAGYFMQRVSSRPTSDEEVRSGILAFQHLIAAGDGPSAATVMDKLDYSLVNHHKFVAWMQLRGYGYRVLEMRDALRKALTIPELQVENLAALGWDSRRIDKPAVARQRLKEAMRIADERVDKEGAMYARAEFGFVLNDCFHDFECAKLALMHVRDVADAPPKNWYWRGMALLGLAYTHFDFDCDDDALKYADQSYKAFSTASEPHADLRKLDSCVRLCMCRRKMKQFDDARAAAEEALETAQKVGSAHWQAEALSQLGFNERATGDYGKALARHEEALRLNEGPALSLREQVAQHSYCANLLADIGCFDQAIGAYRTGLALAQSLDLGREQAWTLSGLGLALVRVGALAEARDLQQLALHIVQKDAPAVVGKRDANARSEVVRRTDLAETLLASGEYEEAQSMVQQALVRAAVDIHRRAPPPQSAADAYVEARYMADALPHEMQAAGDHQRRGMIVARASLHLRRYEEARRVIAAARRTDPQCNVDTATRGPEAALIDGIVRMKLDDMQGARSCFEDARARAAGLTDRDPAGYKAHLVVGGALLGLAALVGEAGAREGPLREAREAFERAEGALSRPGVCRDFVTLALEIPGGRELMAETLPRGAAEQAKASWASDESLGGRSPKAPAAVGVPRQGA